jgi:hypothetical protein
LRAPAQDKAVYGVDAALCRPVQASCVVALR